MLSADPDRRPTIKELAQNKWVQSDFDLSINVSLLDQETELTENCVSVYSRAASVGYSSNVSCFSSADIEIEPYET